MSQSTTQPKNDGAEKTSILPSDPSRRFWVTTACAVGGVTGVATAVPFVGSFAPSASARAAGAPVEVDLTTLAPGEMRTVEWRGNPIWILHRTEAQLATLSPLNNQLADPFSNRPGFTPEYAQNEWRSIRPEYFICIAICTHLGCVPTPRFSAGAQPGLPADWSGGFFCPCHGSTFDLAGRVFMNKPAPDNLEIPPYSLSADGTRVIIGVAENEA